MTKLPAILHTMSLPTMHRSSLNGDTWNTHVTPVQEPKTRNRAIKACHECRTRKAKCDKDEPQCHNCRKYHRECIYMTDKPDPISRDSVSRIKKKARHIENKRFNLPRFKGDVRLSSQGDTFQDDDSTESGTPLLENAADDSETLLSNPLAVADAAYDDDAEDDDPHVEQSFGVGQFSMTDRIGSFFRPKLAEEITHMLSLSHPSDPTSYSRPASPILKFTSGTTYKKPNLTLLFSDAAREDVDTMRPNKDVADRLFEQYWLNVHPISRTVHKPSLEQVYCEIYGEDPSTQLSNSAHALVAASLFAGLVSMGQESYIEHFGGSKKTRAVFEDEMQRFTETSLGCCSLAHTKNFRALQALVAYLIVLCRAHVGRSHLTLVASAIRLAQSIGLHRDGTEYERDPIAVHVRRLIWYQLCFLDIRTTESVGPRPLIRGKEYSTEFPLNVDDDDLEHCDQNSGRFTDMTSTLVDMRCIEVIRSLYKDRANNKRVEDGRVSLDHLLARVANFREELLKDYGDFLNEGIPIQQFTRLKIDLYTSRMYAIIIQHYEYHARIKLPTRLLHIFIDRGIDNLEVSMAIGTNPLFKPWQWYLGAIHQHHYALGMLMEFHMRPEQEEAKRVWKCLDWVFDVPPTHRPLAEQYKSRLILTQIRDQLINYVATQRLRCSTEINNASISLDSLPPEQGTSSDEYVSHLGSTVDNGSISPVASHGLPYDMRTLQSISGWHSHLLPEEPTRSLLLAVEGRNERNKQAGMPINWKHMGVMHSEEVSERIPAPNHHFLQDGRRNPYHTEQFPQLPVEHSFNGRHVHHTAAQQLNYERLNISDTDYLTDTVLEPTIDPRESEGINESGMMSAPHRPYHATYSFNGSPAVGFGSQTEHCYRYGPPFDGSFTHASNYGHQPVEQHYDNSFGGQERHGPAGSVEYRTSSHRRTTR